VFIIGALGGGIVGRVHRYLARGHPPMDFHASLLPEERHLIAAEADI